MLSKVVLSCPELLEDSELTDMAKTDRDVSDGVGRDLQVVSKV